MIINMLLFERSYDDFIILSYNESQITLDYNCFSKT